MTATPRRPAWPLDVRARRHRGAPSRGDVLREVVWLLAPLALLSAGAPTPGLWATVAPAGAWSYAGHRTVCEIAWRELTPRARAEVRRLTRAFGEYPTFAETCVWADSPAARAIHNVHWINLTPGARRVTEEDCPEDCVLRHLETELSVLADRGRADTTRARALAFVGHFVGDLHQPLHVAYGLDRGGSQHAIVGLGPVDDLHEVWDRYLIEARARDWRAYAARLQDEVTSVHRRVWTRAGPRTWAEESFRIVEERVYQGLAGPGDSRLGEAYVRENLPVAERRLKQAGVRLGALLNARLGTP